MTSRAVFMTGDTVSKNTREFLESTGRPVIEKPFDLTTLEWVMSRELGTPAARAIDGRDGFLR